MEMAIDDLIKSHAININDLYPHHLPLKVFLSYSHKDESSAAELLTHLLSLARQNIISKYDSRTIVPGEADWAGEINSHLNKADIIFLSVSADLLASEYCYGVELKRALDRHETGDARVIPIIVRDCYWRVTPFAKLQVLPRDGRAIRSWTNRDEAWTDVASSIKLVCDELRRGTIEPPAATPTRRPTPFQILPLYTVFKQAGLPTITFIEPPRFLYLKQALEQPGRGVIIEGPSGIGKTSALKHALRQVNNERLEPIQILSARIPRDIDKISTLPDQHTGLVAIDDFHRLPDTLRMRVGDYLKYLADAEDETKS